jgi:EpsI family protein
MRDVKRFSPAVVLLAGCVFVWNARSQEALPLAAPLETISLATPGYTPEVQRLSEAEIRVAGMSTYAARAYRRDSLFAFSTFVSYYERQTKGRTIHSPRNCLPGAGWEVMTAGTAQIAADGKAQTVNRYVLKNGPATALVYYWYQGRGRIVANEYAVKWNLLRDAAVAGHTEEALVRIVVPVQTFRGGDQAQSERFLAAADSLAGNISEQLARQVATVLPRS